ncbi:hypothetical protein PDE_05441 [Penicillium oxalicum 114-2]|uniref:Uncharacterized protein n=1 Tax=Penicillium oxalicum (strain 114-2 / CGMCC 5302) TaxID=933388 RepID=S7ZIM2_PENO1|nr:hypothetical protein PDE_05441 [Penicillium oxalicum 114-2]
MPAHHDHFLSPLHGYTVLRMHYRTCQTRVMLREACVGYSVPSFGLILRFDHFTGDMEIGEMRVSLSRCTEHESSKTLSTYSRQVCA